MADLFAWAMDWLEEQRAEHLSRTVTYERGAASVAIRATIGKTLFEVADAYGLMERVESRDYLVLATELILSGAPVLPARGDRIRETQGTKIHVYEVMAPGREPEWRYSDPYRKTLRIHTKYVGSEDVP